MAEKLYYKIGEACKELDIQPYVLRYWETEFKALSPSKSKSGQRVYAERDLRLIQRIKELLYDEGYTIAGAKKKLESEQASGRKLKPVGKAKPAPKPAAAPPPAPEKEAAAPVAEKPPKKAAPEPKKPVPKAAAKAKPRKAAPPKKAPAAKAPARATDSSANLRVKAMSKAIRKALAEARELQKLLDGSSKSG